MSWELPPSQFCEILLSQYDPSLLDAFKLEMAYGVERFFLLSACLACCWPAPAGGARAALRIVRQWPELDFHFPSEAARQAALQSRFYVPGNSVPIDVDVQHRRGSLQSRIFVTIPRFDEGRPITLGTVDENARVAAYPDYSWHDNQGQNCDGLTSVFRIAVDECNRLWVMDTGKIGEAQLCPPQLLAFDLDSDSLIYRHRVNASNYVQSSLFITPVVDVRSSGPGDCSDTFVYVADVTGFGMLVVDIARDRSWRVTHRLMFPFPSKGTFTIDGESFDLMDGVLGMALSPLRRGRDRYLYFHALASTTENVVRTGVLRNDSFLDDPNADPKSINVFPEERPSQSAAEAMDRDGILFFGLMEPPSVWCWNSATEYAPRNFHQVALDRETLQFASGMKVPSLLDVLKLEMAYGVERFFLLSACLACYWPAPAGGASASLGIVRQWSELNFNFPSEAARRAALQNRFYVPGKSVPIDIDVQYTIGGPLQPRIFITIPRLDEGRPITLGTVDENALVTAYPDYSWHDNQGQNCDGLTSVYRVAMDVCNRLWVMDTGKIGMAQLCPPQLLAFDLDSDNLIYRHRVNSFNYVQSSKFVTPVVDVRNFGTGDCSDTFVYVADVTGFGMLVVDVAGDRSWRVTHRLMYPFPSRGTFIIDGESFDVMDGVLGMALSPLQRDLDRYLYFHALASTTENVVRTSLLRSDSFLNDPNADSSSIIVFPMERISQSAAEAMDRDGILFFGLMEPPSVWCWNSATEYATRNFYQIAFDGETLPFTSGMKVVNTLNGDQELWIVSSNFQSGITGSGSLQSDRVNFRIQAQNIPQLLENSPCRSPLNEQNNGLFVNLVPGLLSGVLSASRSLTFSL